MPVMELRLEKLIDSVQVISNIDDLNDETPMAVRIQDPETEKVTTLICSLVEPTRMVIPMNAIWVNFDRNSPYFKQALRRISKSPNPSTPVFEQTWELMYFYDEVFIDQFYDPADLEGSDVEPVVPATESILGIVKLTTPPANPAAPRVISEGHYTLSNTRDPLPHLEQHPELPATMVKTNNGFVTIQDQPAPAIGMTLVLNGSGSAVWRKLEEDDILMGE